MKESTWLGLILIFVCVVVGIFLLLQTFGLITLENNETNTLLTLTLPIASLGVAIVAMLYPVWKDAKSQEMSVEMACKSILYNLQHLDAFTQSDIKRILDT